MTRKVMKANGKFVLVPTSADVARSKGKSDKTKAEDGISDADLPGILHRILERLDALENN